IRDGHVTGVQTCALPISITVICGYYPDLSTIIVQVHSAPFKPNLLAIVPPYAVWGPPAGAAALLVYLKASGCRDFSFLDLRLFEIGRASCRERVVVSVVA